MSLVTFVHACLYVIYTFVRIPLWTLLYVHPSFRQHVRWTWRQALRVRLFRAFVYFVGLTRPAPPLSMQPGKEGKRFIVIQPAEEDVYRDVLTCDEQIKPSEVGATWYPDLPSEASDSECTPLLPKGDATSGQDGGIGEVVLHFHGGGYMLGDGRTGDCGFAASTILAHTPPTVTHVLCPQYRLCTPGNRFPAAFQDALSSYIYLVLTLGIPASKVVLSGDSAGGHVVIQLLRYLAGHAPQLGLDAPRAAWLWSPWCDVKTALEEPAMLYRIPQYRTDFMPSHHFLEWAAEAFPPRPATGVTLDHAYVSPLGHSFKLPCRVFAMIGGVELNVAEVTAWCEEMKGVEGNEVELWVEEDAPHDVIKCGAVMGFKEEAARGVEMASRFTWLD